MIEERHAILPTRGVARALSLEIGRDDSDWRIGVVKLLAAGSAGPARGISVQHLRSGVTWVQTRAS